MFSKKNVVTLLVLVVVSLLVAACGAATPETIVQTVEVEKEVKVVETVEVEKEVVKTVEVEKEVVKEVVKEVEVTAVPEEREPVELRVAWWGSQNRHTRTIGVIKMFEQQYPWIKITYEPAGWDDYWTKINTQVAGGNLPDVMQHDLPFLQEYVDNGLLVSLDGFADSGVLDFTNVSDAVLEGGQVNGELYALNLGNNTMVMAIDADAFEQAGLDLPAPDWTWADFEETVLKLHENLGIWGMGTGLNSDQLWKALYLGYGSWVYTDDGGLFDPSLDYVLIDYLNMVLRLQEAGAIPSYEEVVAAGYSLENQPLVTGDAAMGHFWSNQLVAVWTAAGPDRNLKLVPMPRPEGGQSMNYIQPSQFWTITSHAKHPEEGAMFLDFFTNSVEANEVLLAERGVPISSVVREALVPLLEPAQVEIFELLDAVEGDASPLPPLEPAGSQYVSQDIYEPLIYAPVMYGQMTPEEGMALLRELATEALAEAQQ